MPNLKSAKKRVRQNEVRHAANQQVRTRVKHARRAVNEALSAGDSQQGSSAVRAYHSILDKAAKKGVITRNTAIRRKANASNRLRGIA